MLINEDKKLIQKCIMNAEQLLVERERVGGEKTTLIPIALSDNIILGQYINDFLLDGYRLMTLDELTAVSRGPIEEYHDEIFKQEGLVRMCNPMKNISVTNWQKFFCGILQLRKVICIYRERVDDGRFFVGRAISVHKEYLELLKVNQMGVWGSETIIIAFDEITMVSFDDKYSQMLDKYSKKKRG